MLKEGRSASIFIELNGFILYFQSFTVHCGVFKVEVKPRIHLKSDAIRHSFHVLYTSFDKYA